MRHLRNYEDLLTRAARRRNADGVICGHSHQPQMREINDVLFCNTGDWIHHCTALVEHPDGELELLWWRKMAATTAQAPQQIPSEPATPGRSPRSPSARIPPQRRPMGVTALAASDSGAASSST